MHAKTVVVSLMLFLAASVLARGDDTQLQGMIIARAGETLVVSSPAGRTTVVLTADTDTKDDKGLFGLDKEHMANTVLIPGLKVSVKGATDEQGRIVAKIITLDGDDLETAELIQAGLHPTANQVAENMRAIESHQQALEGHGVELAAQRTVTTANKQQIDQNIENIDENTRRFTALSEYDVKAQATVKFNVGSSIVSAEDEAQLKQLAQTATALNGYIIEVTGYADSTGSAAINTKLSEERAKGVIAFLMQQGNVPVRHIVAPGAMGEFGPTASNETTAGRAENRRVEVKVLVNKGIAGS